jgi:amino acid adenylation domain-containing protein
MLLDKFAWWAEQQPSAVALLDGSSHMTYAELWAAAERVASALHASGIEHGDRVALYLPKDSIAIVCLLGVLRASAAYVPIDPRAPVARVKQILTGCSPRVLITAPNQRERLDGDWQMLSPQQLTQQTPGQALNRTEQRGDASATAYILYTSGSTGVPKGVVVSHRAAEAFVGWACDAFSLAPHDRLTSFAPLSFDLSIFDLFAALSSGASVVNLAPELLLRPIELVRHLQQSSPTTIYAVPSTIRLLVQDGKLDQSKVPHLQRVLYAGEPFPIPQLSEAMTALPAARFYNLFGPTETNVCTYHPLEKQPSPGQTQVPIGRACAHLRVDLLDAEAHPVAPGEEGELCVAGASVMTEYFGNSEATRAAFYPGSRFPDGERRYRTGDHARLDATGQFWFLGRRDRLVKRRGYRIELGDIESALLRHPAIHEAAVVAETSATATSITAFVTLRPNAQASTLILRTHCGSLLLPYMVPDSIRIVPTLPRTLSGKVDFLRLLRPDSLP